MQCRAQTPKTKGKGEFCAVSFADSSAIPKRPVRGGTLSWEIGESPVEHARSRVQTFFFNEKKTKKKQNGVALFELFVLFSIRHNVLL